MTDDSMRDSHTEHREASLRFQTSGVRWPNQAGVPQEGEDDEEDCLALAVRYVQTSPHAPDQALQDVRNRR